MHGLEACIFEYITVAAFRVYAQCGEDFTKRGGWKPCKIIEITLLIIENHGKIMELFLNFCGNPVS